MSKKFLCLAGIVLTIIIGSILYRYYCCNCSFKNAQSDQTQVSIPPAAPAPVDWNGLRDKLNADPLIFYFESKQSGINLTPEEKQKISDISRYLDNVPAGLVIVTGYTDNAGSRTGNLKLGQDRADFIKSYLVKNSISESKITATSKGPDEPVADNNTPEGKAKNRRTVVLLK
jgi:OmpA-OmpF porin, OOP family